MIDRSAVIPGFRIPTFSRGGTYHHWNRFAAANYEFADHHMDDEVGRLEGFEGAIGMGPLIFAYMHCMLRDWIELEGGVVTSVRFNLRSPFLRRKTLLAGGIVKEVSEADDGALNLSLDIWADDNDGIRLVDGTATASLFG